MMKWLVVGTGLAALLLALPASAESPRKNVHPSGSRGGPGSGFYDLMEYHRRHPRRSTDGSKDVAEPSCPNGGSPPCESGDFTVTFSGATALDVEAIRSVFGTIANIAAQEIDCRTLTAVRAEVLAADGVPANDLAKQTPAPANYERWTATLCSKDVAFLVGVWADDGKQATFRVVYPFEP